MDTSPALEPSPTGTTTAFFLFQVNDTVEIAPGLIAGVAIAVGIAMGVFGGVHARAAGVVSSSMIGGVLLTLLARSLCDVVAGNDGLAPSHALLWSYVALFSGSTSLGLVTARQLHLARFSLGATAGAVVSCLFSTTYARWLAPHQPDTVLLLTLLPLSVVGGLLALHRVAAITAIAASLVAAQMVTWGIGYFVGGFASAAALSTPAPSHGWIYNIVTLALFAINICIQYQLYGKDALQDADARMNPLAFLKCTTPRTGQVVAAKASGPNSYTTETIVYVHEVLTPGASIEAPHVAHV